MSDWVNIDVISNFPKGSVGLVDMDGTEVAVFNNNYQSMVGVLLCRFSSYRFDRGLASVAAAPVPLTQCRVE